MIRAIAIDDEPVALDIIRIHAQKINFLKLDNSFSSGGEAMDFLESATIDLVFLDINMPDISGLELAKLIKYKTQVIFTTAYVEHALKGFDLAVTDYLLKPINFSRFLQACQLANSRKQKMPVLNNTAENALFVKDGHNWVSIILANILYIQGQDNYISIVEQDKKTLTRMTLNEVQNRLPDDQFMRIHKSYITSLFQISKIENHQVVIKDIKVPLSRAYREELLKKINTF
ncbi:LytR/AlgR family response regulator transcription factor [Sphingobacterium anhuiense]|uniref:LytR/AlgR family response regulator transcription factor n=1 Tax=Sphingobacterium anhuiense TaxID=493780 RepID=UPI003C2EA445